MTLLDYANWVPLPAPVTTGTTVQSFTSPDGEVYVAKNGVNSGQWRRARDVVKASICRNAAYTSVASAYTVWPADAIIGNSDPYGFCTLGVAAAFNTPIAGWYHVQAQIHFQGSTTAGRCVLALIGPPYIGTRPLFDQYNPASQYINATGSSDVYCPAGTAIQIQYLFGTVWPAWLGPQDNYFTVVYTGTG